jgi:hypothetical protein
MTRSEKIKRQSDQVVERETERIQQNSKTINATNSDPASRVQADITDKIAADTLQSAIDDGLIDDATQVPQFQAQVGALSASAVNGVANPGANSGLSQALATGESDFAARVMRDSTGAKEIQSISNRSLSGDSGLPTSASSNNILHGSGGVVQQSSRGTFDNTKKAFNTAFGLLGMAIGFDPELFVGAYSSASVRTNSKVARMQGLINRCLIIDARVIDLVQNLDDAFFEVPETENVRAAATFLRSSDIQLTQVRSQMITLGAFPSGLFEAAKNGVRNADDALDDDLEVTVPTAEIYALLDELEKLLTDIEALLNDMDDSLDGLTNGLDQFIESRTFGAVFAGMVQMVQTEIRSLVENMEVTLVVPRRAIINSSIPLWRVQLKLIEKTMCGLAENIQNYLDDDPNEFVADIGTAIDALANSRVFRDTIEEFVAVQRQFIQGVRRVLELNTGLLAVLAFGARAALTGGQGVSQLDVVSAALTLFPIPSDAILGRADDLVKLLDQFGLDRASESLQNADFEGLFAMTALTATFTGAALDQTTEAIRCVESQEFARRQDLELLTEVQAILLEQKQLEDLASQTFNQWKERAIDRINSVELPIVQTLDQKVRELVSNFAGTPCDVDC